MYKKLKLLLLSIILPLLFLAVATSPVGILGCQNRGLIAVIIASASAVFAFVVSIISLIKRMNGKTFDPISLICTLFLVFPPIYIIVIYYNSNWIIGLNIQYSSSNSPSISTLMFIFKNITS